ncbi:MAG: butyrate kinase [Prevotellaceae bacterium]|jgi:butyrate kinase|nr:butyrate kinase [Prevotellaceae bacterium]
MKILVINPGSTSTKLGVYTDERQEFVYVLRHSAEELVPFPTINDQFEFRKQLILRTLSENGIPFLFDAIIGRGGLLKPMESGVYEVNEAMRRDLLHAQRAHASNLGGLIADALASSLSDCKAYIADPVVVDELADVARITGLPQLPRVSIFHALNHKAIARRYAHEQGKAYEDLDLIVCHMGGGISVAAHQRGRVIDVNNALDGEGTFSPERTGTLPVGQLVDLCYSGQYTHQEMRRLVCGRGGVYAHLGTTDMIQVERRAQSGDSHAQAVIDAMIYRTAKAVGGQSIVLHGHVDAILLTGGIVYSDYVRERLTKYISFIAPVHAYPGEDELQALADNALAVLRGERTVKIYS